MGWALDGGQVTESYFPTEYHTQRDVSAHRGLNQLTFTPLTLLWKPSAGSGAFSWKVTAQPHLRQSTLARLKLDVFINKRIDPWDRVKHDV